MAASLKTPAAVAGQQYALIAAAIEFIRAHALEQPALAQVAAHVGLSEFHFQRLFAQWAGVSPKRFLQFLTKEHAKESLRESADVLGAALAAGLSTPSRLHDLIVTCEAMTPGEVKSMGAGVTIGYGQAATPFGDALIGWTPRGICSFDFFDADRAGPLMQLKATWRHAEFERSDTAARDYARRIFPSTPGPGQLHVVLRGTNFQMKVWEALLRTAPSQVLSYAQLAAAAGVPKAPRAVGSALAANVVGYLIPCHRVIQGGGDSGHYRWGPTRKRAILGWEAARR